VFCFCFSSFLFICAVPEFAFFFSGVYRFFLRFPWPAVPFSRVSPILLPQEHVSHLSNDFFAYSRVGHVKVTCARGSRVCTLHPPHIHTHIHINPPPFVPYTPIFGPLCTIIISHIVLLSHLSLLHRIGSVLPHALPYHTPALLTREGMDSLFFTPISRRSHACSSRALCHDSHYVSDGNQIILYSTRV
jgi:hypothetical protein